MKKIILLVAICGLSTSQLDAAGLESIPADAIEEWGPRLVDKANMIEEPQIKIVPDVDKANGVHVPDLLGVIVVPQKDLEENEELAAKFRADKGAPLAYLFAYRVLPVINGQRVATDRLPTISVSDDDGSEYNVFVLRLSVRQVASDDYRLYGFGKDKSPIVDAKFSQSGSGNHEPVAIELSNPDDASKEGDVVITVFDKYQASFRAGHIGE